MIRYFNLWRPFQGLLCADPPLVGLSLDVCRPACTSNTNPLKGHFREAGLCTLSRVNRTRHYVQTWGERFSFPEDMNDVVYRMVSFDPKSKRKTKTRFKSKMLLLRECSTFSCNIRFLRPPFMDSLFCFVF